MSTATPQDTQDHMLGSGALSWSWWVGGTTRGMDTPAWEATLTIEDPLEEGIRSAVINHEVVLATARQVVASAGKMLRTPQGSEYPAWSRALEQQCWRLLTDPDDADFDASSADELLQLAVTGVVAYG
jgi:hypothetical protein